MNVRASRVWAWAAALPRAMADSFFRSTKLSGARRRTAMVANTFFLHFHPVRVHPRTFLAKSTLGLGHLTFYLFVVCAVSGVLLTFYYVPTTEGAYGSILDTVHLVSFGRFVRNFHRWTAEAMTVTVGLHLLRVFFMGAYKRPREFNWVIGVLLLVLTLALSFTGYLLPWDQTSYWAVTVGTTLASYFPVIGGVLRTLLLGGHTVGDAALLRFYVLHLTALPAITAIIIAYHFWRVRKEGGLARPESEAGQRSVFSFPRLMYLELALFLGVLAVFLPLALALDAPLGPAADPLHPPNPAKAPWYFVAFQELVSYSAFWGGAVIPLALLAILLLLPYMDRNPEGAGRWFSPDRRVLTLLWTAGVLTIIILTVIGVWFRGPNWGFYWPWEGWPGPR